MVPFPCYLKSSEMDISAIEFFVEENGTVLDLARFRRVLYSVDPPQKVIQPFLDLQNEDGGFPCGMAQGNSSAVHKTVTALMWLDELGQLASGTSQAAIAYLLSAQLEDGGWDEDPSLIQYGLPPWICPGTPETRGYLSANAAFWLAVAECDGHAAIGAALQYLVQGQDDTGVFYESFHGTWIATSVFMMAGPEYGTIVKLGLRALESKPLNQWEDSQIAWALECLGRAGAQKELPFVERCLDELMQRWTVKEGWCSEDGPAGNVGATIAVLKVLKNYEVLGYI
jgi:hypothetical protein